MSKVAATHEVKAKLDEVKAKMAVTSKEYIPIPKEDPWTMQVAPPVQTMEQAVEMVKDVLGGTPIDESCIHGARIWKTGTSKAGKAWGGYMCAEKNKAKQCSPRWFVLASDGQWKPQV